MGRNAPVQGWFTDGHRPSGVAAAAVNTYETQAIQTNLQTYLFATIKSGVHALFTGTLVNGPYTELSHVKNSSCHSYRRREQNRRSKSLERNKAFVPTIGPDFCFAK